MSVEDEIEQVKYELSRVQKNKATEHYIGNLKARLSKLLAKDTSRKTGGKSYAVKKQGDATVALVGFPSVGKSTLLNALTGAHSKTASYEFTTLIPIPGMLHYRKALIQLIDAPGIIGGAAKGKGLGRQIIGAVRNADLILILLDPVKDRLDIILDELYDALIRLDVQPPDVQVKRTTKGGLVVQSTVDQSLSLDTIKSIVREFGFVNAELIIRENVTDDRLIDALNVNRVYVPSIVVVNKVDQLSKPKVKKLQKKYHDALFVSAEKGLGLEGLKEAIWQKLEFKRVYLKRPGKEPDLDDPLILRGHVTVKRVIKKLRKDYDSAKVWGKSVKHQGLTVSLKHELQDEDVVTLT